MTQVVGTFESDIKIENEKYQLKLSVVPTHTIPYNVILGQDFLEDMQVRQREIIKMRRIPPTIGETKDQEGVSTDGHSETECSEVMKVLCTEVRMTELDTESKYKDKLETVIAKYMSVSKVSTKIETV